MYTIPAFGPWPEQNAGPDEEKRLNSAQQSKTSPTSIDREHETGVFYGSGKLPYQTSLAACTCNDFVKRKKPCKHIYRLAMELGIIPLDYKTGRSSGERNEAQISFEDSIALVEQLSEAAQKHIENMLYYTSERVDDRQRDVYKYLRRKYEMETDWYTGLEYPAGAGLSSENELVFYFPEDRVTAALTKYGCNRCLHGYIPTKSNR